MSTTYRVTTAKGTRDVVADRLTFEPSGHAAFWESRRGDSDRLVFAADDAFEIEEQPR